MAIGLSATSDPPGTISVMTMFGRWVDRFERRDGGSWKIAKRVVPADWVQLEAVVQELPFAREALRSRRVRSDVLYDSP